jgi:hypothetical protein
MDESFHPVNNNTETIAMGRQITLNYLTHVDVRNTTLNGKHITSLESSSQEFKISNLPISQANPKLAGEMEA